MVALSVAYLAVVSLRGNAQKMGFIFAIVCAIAAALIGLRFVPANYLMELVRFYSFFYPLLFAGLGLWVAFVR